MADDDFKAGLTDQDELSMYPSAASPLTAAGIDPDEAMANPSLMASLSPGYGMGPTFTDSGAPAYPPAPAAPIKGVGGMTMPGLEANMDTATGSEQDAAPVSTAPAAAAAPQSATDYGMAGLASLARNADMATDAVQNIPLTNADVDSLSAARSKLATPAPLYDASTGKMLAQTQEYDPTTGKSVAIAPKPSVGSRIWRGVRSGIVGLATGGIPGAIVGALEPQDIRGGTAYGAPNSAYTKAEQARQDNLASTDDSLKTAFQNWKAQQDAAKERATQYRADATLGKDLTTGSTSMQNSATDAAKLPIDQQKADAETMRANNESPDAKLQLSQSQVDQRTQQAQRLRLSGTQKALYILNGKVPEPQQMNEAQYNSAQVNRVLSGYRASHDGKDPQTAEDWNGIYAAAKGSYNHDPNAGTMMLVPDGKGGSVATLIKPGSAVPQGSVAMAGKGSPAAAGGTPQATVADKNRASLAHVASENLDQIEDVINRRPEFVGKMGGRISSVEQMIGSNDPDLIALGNSVHNFAMANAGVYGSRSHQNVVDAENELIGHMKSGVEGIWRSNSEQPARSKLADDIQQMCKEGIDETTLARIAWNREQKIQAEEKAKGKGVRLGRGLNVKGKQ